MAANVTKASVFRSIAQSRRSCKRFRPGLVIDDDVLKDVLQSTLRYPSSFNLQPTQLIMVQDQSLKDRLAEDAMLGTGNQYRTRDCSTLAVFLADKEPAKRIQRIYELEKEWGKRHPTFMAMFPLTTSFMIGAGHAATLLKQVAASAVSEWNLHAMPQIESTETWSYKNTSLAVQSYVLAASSHDLATSIMEGYDSSRMKRILHIPDRYGIPMVVATGFDYDDASVTNQTPRLSMNEFAFRDTFGEPLDDLEKEYDKQDDFDREQNTA